MEQQGYKWKIKYNPLSLKETYDYLDLFIEDFFYYKQYYYPYYKLVLHKSDFNFETLTISTRYSNTPLDGQQYIKFDQFPIVHVDNFTYNYIHYQFENLPSQNRTIRFQVLGKILQPSEGDIVHIYGYQFFVTKVEHDIRHDLYLCTQQDLWTIDEFNSYLEQGIFKVYKDLSEMIVTKFKMSTFDFITQKEKITPDKLPKSTVRVKVEKRKKSYDYDNVQINTSNSIFLEDIDEKLET